MKNLMVLLILLSMVISNVGATLYIGAISSEDLSLEELIKINDVFLDVWSEKSVFNRIKEMPEDDVSRYVRSLNLAQSDNVVTGKVLVLGQKSHLRVDVYNHEGARIHVSREVIESIESIYGPMIRTRDQYYTPIKEAAETIEESTAHQFGWSLTLGAVFSPEGYSYTVMNENKADTTLNPYSFALTDIALVDQVGQYRDVLLSFFLHYNFRADIGIGMGVKKIILKSKAHSPSVAFEAGLNKLIIQDVMGDDTGTNYVGSRDGVMLTPRVGMVFFRDQKINIFTDVGYTFVLSERQARYPHLSFGLMSSWDKRRK